MVLVCLRQRVKDNALPADDLVTLLDVVDLTVNFTHLVFCLVDYLFVCVAELKLEVLRPRSQRQVLIVKVLPVHFFDHLSSASRNRKAFFNLEVARVWYLLESLVFSVVPWLQEIAECSSILVSCGQQLFYFVLDFLL